MFLEVREEDREVDFLQQLGLLLLELGFKLKLCWTGSCSCNQLQKFYFITRGELLSAWVSLKKFRHCKKKKKHYFIYQDKVSEVINSERNTVIGTTMITQLEGKLNDLMQSQGEGIKATQSSKPCVHTIRCT